MTYQVPAASKTQGKKKSKPFGFTIAGKSFEIPAFGELISPQELIELATLPLAEQNGVSLQKFARSLPPEAVKLFKSNEQVTALFQAWQAHGNQGVNQGESGASAA